MSICRYLLSNALLNRYSCPSPRKLVMMLNYKIWASSPTAEDCSRPNLLTRDGHTVVWQTNFLQISKIFTTSQTCFWILCGLGSSWPSPHSWILQMLLLYIVMKCPLNPQSSLRCPLEAHDRPKTFLCLTLLFLCFSCNT
jgi:hypothetical protein